MNKEILKFGTSGIRGVYNKDFSINFILKLAFSLSYNLKGIICIGHDTRKSSYIVTRFLISILSYFGKKTIYLGCAPTPVIAYTTKKNKYYWGLAITASHNPPDYTGIKIFNKNGMEEGRFIEKRIEKTFNNYFSTFQKVNYYSPNSTYKSNYIKDLIRFVPKTDKRLKVLIDSGNGTTNYYTSTILSKLGHKVVSLNSHQTIKSVSRKLEPNVDNLLDTGLLVKKMNCDLGIAHDGDGDRITVINSNGKIIEEQTLSSLIVKLLFENKKNIKIIVSTNTSESVNRLINKLGFTSITAKIGKTFLEINKNNADMSLEPNKFTYRKWGLWEDGIFVAVFLCQYLSSKKLQISKVVKGLPRNFYYQTNIISNNKKIMNFKKNIISKYKNYKINENDGIKVFYNNSFILFRISGTEQKIRVYADSKNRKLAKKLLIEGINLVIDN